MTLPQGHPPPEVPARDATETEISRVGNRNTRTVVRIAEAHGWLVRATYSKGHLLARGKPGELVESIMLRMRRGQTWIAATWVDGKFYTGLMIGQGTSNVHSMTATAVTEALSRKESSDA